MRASCKAERRYVSIVRSFTFGSVKALWRLGKRDKRGSMCTDEDGWAARTEARTEGRDKMYETADTSCELAATEVSGGGGDHKSSSGTQGGMKR
jgi:hypothetical protein